LKINKILFDIDLIFDGIPAATLAQVADGNKGCSSQGLDPLCSNSQFFPSSFYDYRKPKSATPVGHLRENAVGNGRQRFAPERAVAEQPTSLKI